MYEMYTSVLKLNSELFEQNIYIYLNYTEYCFFPKVNVQGLNAKLGLIERRRILGAFYI